MDSSRRWRRALITAAALVGLIAVVALAGLPVYVFPPHADPGRADVVQVLGPPLDERMAMARRLVDEGRADAILVSVAPPGAPASVLGFCDDPIVTCATPDPYTTDGETILLTEYARAHDVERAIVLTDTGHVARARFIYGKCYPGEAVVVEVPTDRSVVQWGFVYAYQTAAFLKAALLPCAAAAR